MYFQDWLKPASVSLAKLDEVKANVYNLGLADPKQLKATSGNLTVKQIDSINTQPPLSSLVQQRHVWLVSVVQSQECNLQPKIAPEKINVYLKI